MGDEPYAFYFQSPPAHTEDNMADRFRCCMCGAWLSPDEVWKGKWGDIDWCQQCWEEEFGVQSQA